MNLKTFYRNVYRVVYGKFHPMEYAKKSELISTGTFVYTEKSVGVQSRG